MTHEYQDSLKPFLKEKIMAEIRRRRLTNEQAAEILRISPRSLAYLRDGTNMPGAATLLMFLVRLCENTEEFVASARELVDKIEEVG